MSFGVNYAHPQHTNDSYAVDWDIWEKGRWVVSSREFAASRWDPEREDSLNSLAYEAILDKFGLTDFRDELPPQVVEFMSPRDLAEFRKKNGLSLLIIMSDNDRRESAEDSN